ERNYNVSPVNLASSAIPHPSLWAGDFSHVNDSVKPDVGSIVLTPTEIANNTVGGLGQKFITIPTRLLNTNVQKLITTYFPKIGFSRPTDTTKGTVPDFQTLDSGQSVQDLGTLRVDYDFGDNDHVYVVYNASAQTNAASFVQSPYAGLGLTQNDRSNGTLSF